MTSGVGAFGHGRDACEPSSGRGGPRSPLLRGASERCQGVHPEGAAGGVVSQQNGRRLSQRDGSGGQGGGGGSGEPGLREAVAAAAGLPPPGLGPQSLTCGPAPSRAPPASGTQAAGRGGWASNFLLPAPRPGSDSRAGGRATNTKEKLFAPHAPKQIGRGRGAGATLAGSGKLALLRPLASVSHY